MCSKKVDLMILRLEIKLKLSTLKINFCLMSHWKSKILASPPITQTKSELETAKSWIYMKTCTPTPFCSSLMTQSATCNTRTCRRCA